MEPLKCGPGPPIPAYSAPTDARLRATETPTAMSPASEAPYEIVPVAPTLRTVAWPQVAFLVLALAAGLTPLGLALVLAL